MHFPKVLSTKYAKKYKNHIIFIIIYELQSLRICYYKLYILLINFKLLIISKCNLVITIITDTNLTRIQNKVFCPLLDGFAFLIFHYIVFFSINYIIYFIC